MKFVLFANTDWYLYNFRLPLVVRLRELGHDVLLVSPPGPYGKSLRAMGLEWKAVPMIRRSLNPLREIALLWHLWRLMRRASPDVIHCFTIKCVVYGSIAARLARVPARVNAVAGLGYVFSSTDFSARMLRPIVRTMLRVALGGDRAHLILQNKDDLRLFEKGQVTDRSKLHLIRGSGVDRARFFPSGRATNRKEVNVLLAARLLWDKGIWEYVEAARILLAEGRSIRFLLAGEPDLGNPASVSEQVIHKWMADGEVEWLGHIEDMPKLLATVDIVVLPSYREGLPKSLIEAAACGLPLVTTDVPGCREVVRDGVNGLLIPVRDPIALANAIARLQDDPELAARLGAAARAKALAEFDEQIILAQTLAVYEEVLGSS